MSDRPAPPETAAGDAALRRSSGRRSPTLPDGASVVVVGGGPAGAFFAIRAARRARALSRNIYLTIIERHGRDPGACAAQSVEGCNYCAGGISPNLFDIMSAQGFGIPPDIVESRAASVTIHGDWKSIELPVPEGRSMISVFRGTRPRERPSRHENFDAFLLGQAAKEGAGIIAGEVLGIRRGRDGRPAVTFRRGADGSASAETIEADFVAVSAGVNPRPGMDPAADRFFKSLKEVLPRFRPPRVRKALIGEMRASPESLRHMKDEVHFAQYGSKSLRIEMSSLIPKGRWMTVVLLGRSIDRADPADRLDIVERFLTLSHIRRLIPGSAGFSPACLCFPNMTVGRARGFIGDGLALVGDIAVSRLYKDGINSAFATASALADGLFDGGTDRKALERSYGPAVRRIARDNAFGSLVFLLSRVTFSRPLLSRIAYQAVLTERKTKPRGKRRLADVLWKIASGDDSYRRILLAMGHPATVFTILRGGALVTLRNVIAERILGLSWRGFGRYQTGVELEVLERKRRRILDALGFPPFDRRPDFEKMYSIKIKAPPARIFDEIGKFGDADRLYFKPRLIDVRRTSGSANIPGTSIRYDVVPRSFSFGVVLEKVLGTRLLLYRVRDGFARGGLLVFDIEEVDEGVSILSVYVAFDFPRGRRGLRGLGGAAFRLIFPAFVHDVIWNHSMCMLKHLVENDSGRMNGPGVSPDGRSPLS